MLFACHFKELQACWCGLSEAELRDALTAPFSCTLQARIIGTFSKGLERAELSVDDLPKAVMPRPAVCSSASFAYSRLSDCM